jgi:toxin CcdB
MSQFDVHRLKSGATLVVDCQSELLEHLSTRMVVPLISREQAPVQVASLNPLVSIDGQEFVMATQLAAAVLQRDLGNVVASLRDHSFEIVGALDVLFSGV